MLIKSVKENLPLIAAIVSVTVFIGGFLATKTEVTTASNDLQRSVNNVDRSVNILRLEMNMKINDDKLRILDAIKDKTPAQIREIDLLTKENASNKTDKENLIHAKN